MDIFKPNIDRLEQKRDVKGLIKALQYRKDWRVRLKAIEALGNMREAKAFEALAQAWNENRLPSLSTRALLEALGKIGDKRAIELICVALKQLIAGQQWRDAETAANSLQALGWLPADRNEQVLYSFVLDRQDDLAALGDSIVIPLLEVLNAQTVKYKTSGLDGSEVEIMNRVITILGNSATPHAVQPLIRLLRSTSWEVQRALTKIGTPAVEPLCGLIADENSPSNVVSGAASVLGSIGDRAAVEPLIRALGHLRNRPRDCHHVVEALGRLRDRRAVEPLISLLKAHDSPELDAPALVALGIIGGDDARDFLVSTLTYSHMTSEKTAVYFTALGHLGDPSVVPMLLDLYRDNAQIGISDFPIPAFPRGELGDALSRIGPAAVPAILDFVENAHAAKLHRLPLDIFRGALIAVLRAAPSSLPTHELDRISNLPDLWRVASLGQSGDFDIVSEIRTVALDCSDLRDLAKGELAARAALGS